MILSEKQHPITIVSKGRIIMSIDIPSATKFGTKDEAGTPSGKKLDHVILPKLYKRGPNIMIW
jgi:hypothetical protein